MLVQTSVAEDAERLRRLVLSAADFAGIWRSWFGGLGEMLAWNLFQTIFVSLNGEQSCCVSLWFGEDVDVVGMGSTGRTVLSVDTLAL